MFWRKLQLRTKIIVAIAASVVVSFGLLLFMNQKQTANPVSSLSYILEMSQGENYSLSLKDIRIEQRYAPDYQTDIPEGFYRLSIHGSNEFFHGKTVKEYTLIKENMNPETGDSDHSIEVLPLGDFVLALPFYDRAQYILFQDESGAEVLKINLKEYQLEKPAIKRACGDGICSDDENILMCYVDCSY